MSEDTPIAHELLMQAVGLEPVVVESVAEPTTVDDVHMKITFRIEEEDVEVSAFGLIFGLGVLSFHDARPRGNSEDYFEEQDEWQVGDMLRHLRFERGELHFYADYVRGRMMKTGVDIRRDGTVLLETVNRGKSAERWVRTLQGKKQLRVVGGEVSTTDEPEPEK